MVMVSYGLELYIYMYKKKKIEAILYNEGIWKVTKKIKYHQFMSDLDLQIFFFPPMELLGTFYFWTLE